MVDGLAVKPVPTSRFPKDCYFLIVHRGAVIAPMKIQSFKGHTDPPGLSGDLLEFRMIHDAFVLAPKCNGVAAACVSSAVCAAPTVTTASGKTTLACATEGATIYYTLTGADPRYASDAMTYTAPLDLGRGGPAAGLCGEDGNVRQRGCVTGPLGASPLPWGKAGRSSGKENRIGFKMERRTT